nr:flagellin [Desulfosporosinus hippei]
MASLNTYRQMSTNTANSSKSLEKLSSGLRINKAGDDAAGLAISEKMRGQIRGLDQAARNSQDGISMIQTAEGALSETHSILQRMKELATQSANDTNTTSDRSEIQKEMNQLTSEINRIGNTTEFNTQKLLNGGGEKITADLKTITRGGIAGDTAAFAEVTGSTAEVNGVYTLTVDDTDTLAAGSTVVVGGETFTAVSGAADASLGQFSIDGTPDTAGTATSQAASLAAAINENKNLHERFGNVSAAAGVITLTEADGEATGVALTSSVVGAGTLTDAQTTASVKEIQGKYTFNLDKAFSVVGDSLQIAGQTLTAVAANASPASGQFNISADPEAQAKEIAAAINANTNAALGGRFEATVKDNTITLTERATKATGVDLIDTNVVDGLATASAGKYNIGFVSPIADGGRITVDGVDIAVTSDSSDAGLADGTAMLAGSTLTEQVTRLANAVNSNSALNQKYTATVTGDKLTLTQKTGQESLTEPTVTTNSTSKDGFQATFQVGANTAQSMTVEVNDMRSEALNISGTEAGATITASNGNKAVLKATKEVTDGTSNTTTEYALDVSSHEKATAAISVLDDAIQNVSAERSKLGAYQNRLEHTISNLGTSSENLTAAESRIRDVDMAKEMMQFQKNNILTQAAQAMMAQANQQPQGVLQLLR